MLDEFYPVSAGKTMRSVPFMPYLKFSPSAWVLPLKFDGGGRKNGRGQKAGDGESSQLFHWMLLSAECVATRTLTTPAGSRSGPHLCSTPSYFDAQ